MIFRTAAKKAAAMTDKMIDQLSGLDYVGEITYRQWKKLAKQKTFDGYEALRKVHNASVAMAKYISDPEKAELQVKEAEAKNLAATGEADPEKLVAN